jgi:hypothetical protein
MSPPRNWRVELTLILDIGSRDPSTTDRQVAAEVARRVGRRFRTPEYVGQILDAMRQSAALGERGALQ